jgi:hypothetical protein
MPARTMVEHLVGMQAQNPLDPYVALWSRLADFRADELGTILAERQVVRLGLMRTTLHLVSADDALALWPVMQPALARAWSSSAFRKQLEGVDIDAVVSAGRALLEERPRTTSALGKLLHERWPEQDAGSLGYAVRFLLPIVQIPPRGVWGSTLQPTWATLESWVGRPVDQAPDLDRTVVRYLAAFGPASAADIRTWSWLTGIRDVIERLRPHLVTLRDESGRKLLDLPEAPRPDPETPAPPRFLPAFDNVLLSHEDRSRVIGEKAVGRLSGWVGSFLVDGFVAGQWRVDMAADTAKLILEPFDALRDDDAAALVDEGGRLLAFHAPAVAERRVVFGIAREASADDRSPGIGGSRAGGRSK